LPGGRDSLLTTASERNAFLRAAALQLAAGQAAAQLARRAWWPTFFVGAYHAYTENSYLVYPHVNAVLAGVTWDVFDGGSRAADTQRAEAAVTAAARDRLETERAVSIAVDAAWRRWDQARREERTARANVAAAAENLRIVTDQYKAGVARSSDVLDAETLLAQSRFDVVTRHYAIYAAQATLLVAAGWDLVEFYDGVTALEER
jgi:outer membrane protein TolC